MQNRFFSVVGVIVALGFLALAARPDVHVGGPRSLSSGQGFPQAKAETSVDGIIENYYPYLEFVVEAGRGVDAYSANLLNKKYQYLVKHDRQGAARFLKGLRYEMVQKVELMGVPVTRVSTTNAGMRQWVGRFIREWVREADEQIFRSRTSSLVKRD